MTENEKIELFDKWYDENYDEWAEGEEGIALREELEQAFKGGVEVLEAENAELKSDNDARKFAMAMSEKVEKQLREENAKLKSRDCWKTCEYANPKTELIGQHIKDVHVLTNAKEIICEYVRLANLEKEDTIAIWQLYHKAEQFLSEVEK